MARHKNPATAIYALARLVNNLDALSHPKRLHRRVKNIVKGRILGKIGFWRW